MCCDTTSYGAQNESVGLGCVHQLSASLTSRDGETRRRDVMCGSS